MENEETGRGGPTRLTRERKIRLARATILVVIVLSLEYAARAELVDVITLSAPSAMAATAVDLLLSGAITGDVVATVGATSAAFFLAVSVGIPVGWAIWHWGTLQRILDPYLVTLYAMPVFVFYPMLIAIFGLNRIPIVLIAFVLGIVAIVINTANGFGQVKEVYGDVGRSMNLTPFQIFRHIYFPAAVPYIFTGLKLGFIYSLIGVIASEFILATEGLGYLVAYNYQNFATDDMYAVMLLVVVIAIVTNATLRSIEARLYQRSVTA
jgi:NitT/TauT family transport system permease protein